MVFLYAILGSIPRKSNRVAFSEGQGNVIPKVYLQLQTNALCVLFCKYEVIFHFLQRTFTGVQRDLIVHSCTWALSSVG